MIYKLILKDLYYYSFVTNFISKYCHAVEVILRMLCKDVKLIGFRTLNIYTFLRIRLHHMYIKNVYHHGWSLHLLCGDIVMSRDASRNVYMIILFVLEQLGLVIEHIDILFYNLGLSFCLIVCLCVCV